MTDLFDVAVVGGGPAGLSAAVWLSRYLHRVVLIDSGDPRNWETRGVNGFLGLPHIRPAELRALGRDEARHYGAVLVDDTVQSADRLDDATFGLALESGAVYQARRVLLAIGLRDVWPDIPGLEKVYGETAHVCPDCDGYEARGKKTVVIGHGRKAVGMALNLSTWTRDIIICTNGHPPDLDELEYCEKLDALNIPVLTDRVVSVCARDRRVHCLSLENGMDLDADKIFFAIGQYPADDLGAQLGCARDEGGHIIVDEHYHTSVRDVYAAGDIVPGAQLAIAAAADGAIASVAIHKSLVPEGSKLEPLVTSEA
ncbi:MAG TPA: NAD(P)/FAD-dependent oxidoreductase [Gemmatimonadaceae bacterium]|nr:NAD(P)/FAD-dependent oxidoreductase [Gemmatimonadaceae bacterium]